MEIQREKGKKNYVAIFSSLLTVNLLLNIFGIAIESKWIIVPEYIHSLLNLFIIVVLILWVKYLNDLWRAMGKKYGWAIGILLFAPGMGLFIVYAIAISVADRYKKGEEFPKQLELGFKKRKSEPSSSESPRGL
jgi:hypothetical protein